MIFSLRNGEGRKSSSSAVGRIFPYLGHHWELSLFKRTHFHLGVDTYVVKLLAQQWAENPSKGPLPGLQRLMEQFHTVATICIKCPNNAGHCAFLQWKKEKKALTKDTSQCWKMDVNISAWLIISDVTLGKPQLSEWFICQVWRFYSYNGQRRRLRAEQTEEGFYMFSGDFICFWFQRNFHFRQRRNKKGQRTSGLFCLVCFLYMTFHSFFQCQTLKLNVWPSGWSRGWGFFLTCPGISRVLYFFSVQKHYRDIIREFTGRDHAKGPEKNLLCGTQQALWAGGMPKGQDPRASFQGRTGTPVFACFPFTLASDCHLTLVRAHVLF